MQSESWSTARRILCVRLDALGDVLMTTPAIRALKESAEGREVTLLTSRAGARISALVPEIDRVLTYAAPWMKATAPHAIADATDAAIISELRAHRFDAAVIFTVYSQNPLPAALMCYLAGIPLRLAHCRENPYQLLSDWVPEKEPNCRVRHEVRRQLDLVASVGCRPSREDLSIAIPSGARERMRSRLHRLGLRDGHRWLVVHPGASAPSRRYPAESFAEVLRLLWRDGWQGVFVGGGEEAYLVDRIRRLAAVPTHSLAGATTLLELASLLALAPLLIANNSGPVHIAAAVGTPVIDLYALTNPQHTPWMVEHRVLTHDVPCRYCYKSVCPEGHHACLRRIAPSAVVAAVRDLTGIPPRTRGKASQPVPHELVAAP